MASRSLGLLTIDMAIRLGGFTSEMAAAERGLAGFEKELEKMARQGAKLTNSLLTPFEKLAQKITHYQRLLEHKQITPEFFDRAVIKATAEYNKGIPAVKAYQAALKEGKQLADSLLGPYEKLARAIQKINALADAGKKVGLPGAISPQTRDRLIAAEKEKIAQSIGAGRQQLATPLQIRDDSIKQLNQALKAGIIEQDRFDAALRRVQATYRATSASGRAYTALLQEGRALTVAMRTPQEQLAATTARLNGLLKTGAIDWVTYNRAMKDAKAQSEATGLSMKRLLTTQIGLRGGFAALAGAVGLRDLIQTRVEFEGIQATFKGVTGDLQGAQEQFQFALGLVNQLGINLETTTKSYAKFLATAKESNLSLEETQDIFSNFAKAARILNLSAADQEGVFRALTQMMNKTKVTSEELRNQLAERLPGAIPILAKSMGVTTEVLSKMLEKGEVLAYEVLPDFGKAVLAAFGGDEAVAEAANTLGARLERLDTAFKNLKISVVGLAAAPLAVVIEFFTKVSQGLAILSGQSFDAADNLTQRIEAIRTELQRIEGGVGANLGGVNHWLFGGAARKEAEALRKELEKLLEQQRKNMGLVQTRTQIRLGSINRTIQEGEDLFGSRTPGDNKDAENARKSILQQIQALEQQREVLGKNAAATIAYRIAFGDLKDEFANAGPAFAKYKQVLIDAAGALEQATAVKSIEDEIKALNDQAATLNLTEDQVFAYNLAHGEMAKKLKEAGTEQARLTREWRKAHDELRRAEDAKTVVEGMIEVEQQLLEIMGRTGEAAKLKAEQDFKDLREALQRQASGLQNLGKFEIPVTVDTSGIDTAIEQAQKLSQEARVPILVDDSQVDSALQKIPQLNQTVRVEITAEGIENVIVETSRLRDSEIEIPIKFVDPAGFPIDLSKPILTNADGSISTEQTITVEFDDRFYNIPTIVDGIVVEIEQAIETAKAQLAQGIELPNFATQGEAETAAIQRSEAIAAAIEVQSAAMEVAAAGASQALGQLGTAVQQTDAVLVGSQLAKIDKLINLKAFKQQAKGLEDEIDKIRAEFGRREQTLEARVTAGTLSEIGARKELIRIHQEEAAKLQVIATEYRTIAEQSQIPELIEQATELETRIADLKTTTDDFAKTFADAFETNLAQALEDVASGVASLGDAATAMIRGINEELLRMASQEIASIIRDKVFGQGGIFQSFLGTLGVSGVGGAAAPVAGAAQSAAAQATASATTATALTTAAATSATALTTAGAGVASALTAAGTADATAITAAGTAVATAITAAGTAAAAAIAAAGAAGGVTSGLGALAGRGIGPFASEGGLLRGPGTGTSDSILARVSNREYVMPARIVEKPGVLRLLEAMRSGQVKVPKLAEWVLKGNKLPVFAQGGQVRTDRAGGRGSVFVGVPSAPVLAVTRHERTLPPAPRTLQVAAPERVVTRHERVLPPAVREPATFRYLTPKQLEAGRYQVSSAPSVLKEYTSQVLKDRTREVSKDHSEILKNFVKSIENSVLDFPFKTDRSRETARSSRETAKTELLKETSQFIKDRARDQLLKETQAFKDRSREVIRHEQTAAADRVKAAPFHGYGVVVGSGLHVPETVKTLVRDTSIAKALVERDRFTKIVKDASRVTETSKDSRVKDLEVFESSEILKAKQQDSILKDSLRVLKDYKEFSNRSILQKQPSKEYFESTKDLSKIATDRSIQLVKEQKYDRSERTVKAIMAAARVVPIKKVDTNRLVESAVSRDSEVHSRSAKELASLVSRDSSSQIVKDHSRSVKELASLVARDRSQIVKDHSSKLAGDRSSQVLKESSILRDRFSKVTKDASHVAKEHTSLIPAVSIKVPLVKDELRSSQVVKDSALKVVNQAVNQFHKVDKEIRKVDKEARVIRDRTVTSLISIPLFPAGHADEAPVELSLVKDHSSRFAKNHSVLVDRSEFSKVTAERSASAKDYSSKVVEAHSRSVKDLASLVARDHSRSVRDLVKDHSSKVVRDHSWSVKDLASLVARDHSSQVIRDHSAFVNRDRLVKEDERERALREISRYTSVDRVQRALRPIYNHTQAVNQTVVPRFAEGGLVTVPGQSSQIVRDHSSRMAQDQVSKFVRDHSRLVDKGYFSRVATDHSALVRDRSSRDVKDYSSEVVKDHSQSIKDLASLVARDYSSRIVRDHSNFVNRGQSSQVVRDHSSLVAQSKDRKREQILEEITRYMPLDRVQRSLQSFYTHDRSSSRTFATALATRAQVVGRNGAELVYGGSAGVTVFPFEKLYAGKFATGGTIPPYQFGMVGENGKEVAMDSRLMQIAKASQRDFGNQEININIGIDAPQGTVTRPTAEQLAATVARRLSVAARKSR